MLMLGRTRFQRPKSAVKNRHNQAPKKPKPSRDVSPKVTITNFSDLGLQANGYGSAEANGAGMIEEMSKRAPKPERNKAYKTRVAFYTGVVQILCGLLVFISGVVAMMSKARFHSHGIGIWCGVIFGFTGGVLCASANHPEVSRLIRMCAALCISGIILGTACVGFGAAGAKVDEVYFTSAPEDTPSDVTGPGMIHERMASHALLIAFSVLHIILCGVGLYNCVKEMMYRSKEAKMSVVYKAAIAEQARISYGVDNPVADDGYQNSTSG